MTIEVQQGTNPPSKPKLKLRQRIDFKALGDTSVSRPVRVNGNISTQGYAYEDAAACMAYDMDIPLSGVERSMINMVDQGIASFDDLF